jgi:hypothetical protein
MESLPRKSLYEKLLKRRRGLAHVRQVGDEILFAAAAATAVITPAPGGLTPRNQCI